MKETAAQRVSDMGGEWKEILSRNDLDEQNLHVCKGAMPVAWLRVNGLNNKDMHGLVCLPYVTNINIKASAVLLFALRKILCD